MPRSYHISLAAAFLLGVLIGSCFVMANATTHTALDERNAGSCNTDAGNVMIAVNTGGPPTCAYIPGSVTDADGNISFNNPCITCNANNTTRVGDGGVLLVIGQQSNSGTLTVDGGITVLNGPINLYNGAISMSSTLQVLGAGGTNFQVEIGPAVSTSGDFFSTNRIVGIGDTSHTSVSLEEAGTETLIELAGNPVNADFYGHLSTVKMLPGDATTMNAAVGFYGQCYAASTMASMTGCFGVVGQAYALAGSKGTNAYAGYFETAGINSATWTGAYQVYGRTHIDTSAWPGLAGFATNSCAGNGPANTACVLLGSQDPPTIPTGRWQIYAGVSTLASYFSGAVSSASSFIAPALTITSSASIPQNGNCGSNAFIQALNPTGLVCATAGSAGAVTNIAATGPLSTSGTTSNVTLAVSQASGLASGYVSSTDWTTFNNKAATGSCTAGQFFSADTSSTTTCGVAVTNIAAGTLITVTGGGTSNPTIASTGGGSCAPVTGQFLAGDTTSTCTNGGSLTTLTITSANSNSCGVTLQSASTIQSAVCYSSGITLAGQGGTFYVMNTNSGIDPIQTWEANGTVQAKLINGPPTLALYGTTSNEICASGGASSKLFLGSGSCTVAVTIDASQNTQFTGTITSQGLAVPQIQHAVVTLSSGVASKTFATAFSGIPDCTCSVQTIATSSAVNCKATSASAVTVVGASGTATDAVGLICAF